MTEMLPIPEGSIFTITTGEYSDYHVRGVFRATQTIDAVLLRQQWLAEYPKQADRYAFEVREFMGWITRKGLLEPIDAWEWHLGGYGSIDDMDVSVIKVD